MEGEVQNKKIHFIMNEVWQFIIILLQLDLYKNVSPGKRVFFLETFLNKDSFDPYASRFDKTFVWQVIDSLKKNDLDSEALFNTISNVLT